jgi:predicted amidohydrolase YtcJ
MPGLIEPHGHPGTAAVLLSDRVLDLRPVVVPDAEGVMSALRTAIAAAAGAPVYANGWMPAAAACPTPTCASSTSSPDPHRSSSCTTRGTRRTSTRGRSPRWTGPPDPGASFGRTADGELNGVALEAGAVERVAAPLLQAAQADIVELLGAHFADLSRRGITTVPTSAGTRR